MRKRREALNIYLQELTRRPAIAETDDFCIFLQLEKEGGVPGALSAVAAAKGALKVGYVMKQGHYFRQWKRRYDRRTVLLMRVLAWQPFGVHRSVAQSFCGTAVTVAVFRLVVTADAIISNYYSRVYRC